MITYCKLDPTSKNLVKVLKVKLPGELGNLVLRKRPDMPQPEENESSKQSQMQNKGRGQVKLCTGATSSGGFLNQPACEQFQAGHECFAACEQFQVKTKDSHEQCFVNMSEWICFHL